MKKFLSVFVIVAVCLALTACNFLSTETIIETNPDKTPINPGDQKADTEIIDLTRTFYSKYNSIQANVPVVATYEYLTIGDESTAKYPLIKDTLKGIMEENSRDILSTYNDLCANANDFSAMPDIRLFSYSNTFVRRADSRILSFVFSNESYFGGAHGSYSVCGKSIDVQTGKTLELKDITDDAQSLSELIHKKLLESCNPEAFYEADAIDKYVLEQFDSIEWVLDYTGVTFFFNPYEIGPYASGSHVVMIPFDEFPGFKNSEYKKTPESYAVEITPYSPYYFGLDNDGSLNKIQINSPLEQSYGSEPVKLTIDDAEITLSDYSYCTKAMLIHMDNEKNYLYTQIGIEGDSEMYIHELSSFGAKKLDVFSEGLRNTYDVNTELNSEHILTNPHSFEFGRTTSVISTVTMYRSYFVGEKGVPQPFEEHDLYFVSNEWGTKYTLLRPLQVNIVDSKTGEITETKTLNAGEKLSYYRTDGEKLCELKLSDGKIAQIEIDEAYTWPITINGIDVNEIFDGIMFAG